MDMLPNGDIFHETQIVHHTGYLYAKVSPEEHLQ